MASYSIGDVEKITGVKTHILRYWEEIMPFICPKKDAGGRRSYSQRDVDTILRLKYLIYEKKFTIEGAQKQLFEEIEVRENNSEILMEINSLREELQNLILLISKSNIEDKNLSNQTIENPEEING